MPKLRAALCLALLTLAPTALTGCGSAASFVTTSYPARLNFADIDAESRRADQISRQTDPAVDRNLALVPAADFPTTVATAHVQAGIYSGPHRFRHSDTPAVRLVSKPELDQAASLSDLDGLPYLRAVRPVRSLLVRGEIRGLDSVRRAAAALQADMVMVYTFDTTTRENTTVPVVGVASLGILPNIEQKATSRVTGGLLDVRTGYLYGVLEAEGEATQLANGWTSEEAQGDAALRAEQRALCAFVEAAEDLWLDVVAEHGPRATRQSRAAVQIYVDPVNPTFGEPAPAGSTRYFNER